MTVYEELILHLRECAKLDPSENTYKEAADAIEELSKQHEQQRQNLIALMNEKPRWISVEERLPEKPYGCLLIVWDSPYDGGDDFLNYYPRFSGYDGDRWNNADGEQVPFEVVYWMPLPEPPKEET